MAAATAALDDKNNGDDAAAVSLQLLRDGDATLTEIVLQGETQREHLPELARLLSSSTHHHHVTCVTLTDCPLGEHEAVLLKSFHNNITILRLQHVGLTPAGARILHDSLPWKNLQILDVSRNPKLGPRGIQPLAECLSCTKTKCSSMLECNLSNTRLGHFGAKALGQGGLPPTLLRLDVSHNSMGNDGSWKLASALPQLSKLQTLQLSHNQMGDDGASEMGRQFPHLTQLTYLDLSHNHEIGNTGASVIASNLLKNTTLQQLRLSHNQIGNEGAVALAQLLVSSSLCKLQELDLGDNRIEDDGAAALADALSHENSKNLTSLLLGNNRIGDRGAGAFVEHLDDNDTLIVLELQGNEQVSPARTLILDMLLKHRSHHHSHHKAAPKGEEESGGKVSHDVTSATTINVSTVEASGLEQEVILSQARTVLQQKQSDSSAAVHQVSPAYWDICTRRFDTDNVLSFGAFGTLHEGCDSELNHRTYAIRSVNLGETGVMAEARRNVLDDLLVSRKFSQHENVLCMQAYSKVSADSHLFVFDISNLTSLDKCIADDKRRKQMTWTVRLGMMRHVVDALEFLHHHARSSFHGDVKSANIFIASNDDDDFFHVARLVDCGLSRLVATDRLRFQRGDVVFGSRGYRCPRYERGSHGYGPESDIFSLGVVFAELVTGRLQNHVDAKTGSVEDFYYDYFVNKSRDLMKDADPLAGSWEPRAIATLCKISLVCMDSEPARRPDASSIAKVLSDLATATS